MESCMLTWLTCFIHPFANNRERAGVMACLPSAGIAAALVLCYLILEGIGYGNSSEYRTCSDEKITRAMQFGTEEGRAITACATRDPFGWQYTSCNPCKAELDEMEKLNPLMYTLSFLWAMAFCVVMGSNRTKLKQSLGQSNTEPECWNYAVYAPCICTFFGWCATCQESRAVKSRWLANGQQPLGGPQVPLQPVDSG